MPNRFLAIASLAAALVVVSLGTPVDGQDAPATTADDFNGTWRYAGSASQGTGIINNAINETIAPMNFIVRGIAGSRLRNTNQLAQRLTIRISDSNIQIGLDDRNYNTGNNAWAPHRNPNGGSLQVLHRFYGRALNQTFRSDSGTRQNQYSLNNGRLTMSVQVTSDSLPGPLRYRLRYRK